MESEKIVYVNGLKTRVWTFREDAGYGCAECCNGDRCDEDCIAKYRRPNCPHCNGKGWIRPEQLDNEWKVKYDELKMAYDDISIAQIANSKTAERLLKERDALKERCEKMEAKATRYEKILRVCKTLAHDPDKDTDPRVSLWNIHNLCKEQLLAQPLKEGESKTLPPVKGNDCLTREALEKELWVMLPDDCRAILAPLKKSYLESLMADIDSYCEGVKNNKHDNN